jgi:alkylhydroperoxidase family enzyme
MNDRVEPAPRVEPVRTPYPAELQEVLDAIMPPGVPPLTLFTTLARVPRIWDRFRAGSLLDRGPVSLRHREIVIDRTCARCGCAYEWSVHVAFFAQRVALTEEQLRATVHGDSNDPAWSETWGALAATFSVEQILELIALVGFYHSVSFFANGLKLPPEARSVPFPSA